MSAAAQPYPPNEDGYPARYPVDAGPVTLENRGRAGPGPVAVAGVLTILVAAWGGIAPYASPAFGLDATTTSAWSWTLAHALLALVPGAVGMLAGLSMLTTSSRLSLGIGRLGLTTAGILGMLVGGWFVIGPSAWPVLRSAGYFLPGSPLHDLTARIALSYGPGLVVAVLGAFTAGWAVRHRPPTVLHRRGVTRLEPRAVPTQAVPATPAGTPAGATTPTAATGPSPFETSAGPDIMD